MVDCILNSQVIVGQNGIMATPAASAVIRRRKLFGEHGLVHDAHLGVSATGFWLHVALAWRFCALVSSSEAPLDCPRLWQVA